METIPTALHLIRFDQKLRVFIHADHADHAVPTNGAAQVSILEFGAELELLMSPQPRVTWS